MKPKTNEQRSAGTKVLNRAKTIWLTGLSGAGKTTLAHEVHQRAVFIGHSLCVIDGDVVRSGLNADLNFTATDRMENVRRVAEICKMINESGINTIAALISPTRACRALAKDIIGESSFVEIYVNTPLAICEARDPKGLYQRARLGAIKQFTGVSDDYESPLSPHLKLDTSSTNLTAAADEIMRILVL